MEHSIEGAPTKVLVYQEAWGRGGIENFVMNVLRGIDPAEFDVELMCAYDWDTFYDAEIGELGFMRACSFSGRMPSHVVRLVHGVAAWSRRLSRGDVDVVHVNAMNGVTLAYLAIARRRGVPVRVAHSHNTSFSGGMRAAKEVVHRVARAVFGSAATVRLACSRAAGEYLFGNRPFRFVPNGIDVARFGFDASARQQVRAELGVGDETVLVGSVGKLAYQKNPLFAVGVLDELSRRGVDAKLLLVGNGELEAEVSERARSLGLANRYLHVSSVADPESYYCALDVFVLPSLFEGFPFALIEAQCSGLPAVASDAIQDEVCVTDLVRRVPLEAGATAWADSVLGAVGSAGERGAYASKVFAAGFSAKASVEAVVEAWRG